MGKKPAPFFILFLVSSTFFFHHEASPLDSLATKQNLVEVVRKGGPRVGGGSSGRVIPMIGGASMVPRTSGAASPKVKHNAAHRGYSVSIAGFLIIAGFWLQSLACT